MIISTKTKAMLRPLSLMFFVMSAILSAKAQNILTDKIQWNATNCTDLNSNTVVNRSSQIITNGDRTVDWVQQDGGYVNTFSVTYASGAWTDLSQSGSIAYAIERDSLTGEITFSKDNDGITIKLVLMGGTYPINILYKVSTIERQ